MNRIMLHKTGKYLDGFIGIASPSSIAADVAVVASSSTK
jgi:hypothetical protein